MMKRIFLLCCALSFIIIIGVKADSITITTNDYAPFTILTEANEVTGIFAELIEAAFDKVGIEVNYVIYPWARGLSLVEASRVDATIPYLWNAEREKIFEYSDPVMETRNSFFIYEGGRLSSDFAWETYSDFKNYRVGGTVGFWYVEPLQAAGLQLDLVADDVLNFVKLMNHRIETFVGDEFVSFQIINDHFPAQRDKFDVIDKPYEVENLYIIMSQEHPHVDRLMSAFNEGLRQIRESGEYDEIIEKWF